MRVRVRARAWQLMIVIRGRALIAHVTSRAAYCAAQVRQESAAGKRWYEAFRGVTATTHLLWLCIGVTIVFPLPPSTLLTLGYRRLLLQYSIHPTNHTGSGP